MAPYGGNAARGSAAKASEWAVPSRTRVRAGGAGADGLESAPSQPWSPSRFLFSSRLSGGREARGNTLFHLSDLSRSFSADLQTVVRFPDLFPAYAAISPRAALWVTSHEYCHFTHRQRQ